MFGLAAEQRKPPLPYTPDDYLSGVVQMPPWLRFKKQQFYTYSFELTNQTPVNQQQSITLESDSFFLLEAINILAVNISGGIINPVKISFSDTSKGVNWSPNAIALPNISGRGDTTKYLSHPTLFKPNSTLLYSLTSTPSSVSIYGSLVGRKIFDLTIPEADFLMKRIWYQYDILVGPLDIGLTNSYPVVTANDSDFYLWKMYSAEGITYSKDVAPLLVSLRDATTNKNIFSQNAEIQMVAGEQYQLNTTNLNGSLNGKGFCFTIPRLIKRNSTLLLDIQNTAQAPETEQFGPANFTLEGVRIFN